MFRHRATAVLLGNVDFTRSVASLIAQPTLIEEWIAFKPESTDVDSFDTDDEAKAHRARTASLVLQVPSSSCILSLSPQNTWIPSRRLHLFAADEILGRLSSRSKAAA